MAGGGDNLHRLSSSTTDVFPTFLAVVEGEVV